MKKQMQLDSRDSHQYVRTIVQASVALIILTAALWIGWWPDFAAAPAATESTDHVNGGQSSTQLTDVRMLDQLGQETSYQTIKPLSRGSQLPISEDMVITSASSAVRSSETEQVTTTPSPSTAPDLFTLWQFPLKVEPYTPLRPG